MSRNSVTRRTQGWFNAVARNRALAGDGRAGSWERGEARKRWYAFARDRWSLLSAMALSAAVPITVVAVLLDDAFVRGLIVGGGAVAAIAVMCSLVAQATGTALLTGGAMAEQWTAQELRRLQKDGYRLINHVLIGMGDTDHVLVGPAGVLVVETKWTTHSWGLDAPNTWLDDAARQVIDRANRLSSWNDYQRLHAPPPRAVLFLWAAHNAGSDPTSTRRLQRRREYTVVWGREAAARWRDLVRDSQKTLAPDEVDAIVTVLAKQTSRQEEAIPPDKRPPLSITRLYWSILAAVLALPTSAFLALVAVSDLPPAIWEPLLVVQAGLLAMASRWTPIRPAAVSWLVGLAAVTVLAATVTVAAWL